MSSGPGSSTGLEKLAVLADADLFVLPSYSENFAVSVVEAMACGLPVVVSDQVGIHREVGAAGASVVVPCRADALADALARLSSDLQARREHGARAQYLARQRFSVETMTSELLRLYASLRPSATVDAVAAAAAG